MNGIWNYLGTLIFLAAFLGIRNATTADLTSYLRRAALPKPLPFELPHT